MVPASLAVPPPDWCALLQQGFADGAAERLQVAQLDDAGRLLSLFVGAAGSATGVALPLRTIVADAIRLDARGWLIAHNHPSGDPQPSRADLLLTRRMAAVAAAIEVRLIDHLIFAGARIASFRALGLL